MKKTNKIISILLVLAMMLTMAPLTAFAAETVASGTCGTDVSYVLNSDGVLTVSGSGAMTNYRFAAQVPYYAYLEDIKTVIIEDGVTSVGTYAFRGCTNLTSLEIKGTLDKISKYAFYGCSSMTEITYLSTTVPDFADGTSTFTASGIKVTVPEGYPIDNFAGLTDLSYTASTGSGETTLPAYAVTIFQRNTGVAVKTVTSDGVVAEEATYGKDLTVELEITGEGTLDEVYVHHIYIGDNRFDLGDEDCPVTLNELTLTIPGEYVTEKIEIDAGIMLKVSVDMAGGYLKNTYSTQWNDPVDGVVTMTKEWARYGVGGMWYFEEDFAREGYILADMIDSEGNSYAPNYQLVLSKDLELTLVWEECTKHNYIDGLCVHCGKADHAHSFKYTAGGSRIVATCVADDCTLENGIGGTLTISAPADLYADGTISREAIIDNQLVEATDYTVSYSTADGSAPKTAGTYTASVTVGGATATVEFTLSNYAAKVTDEDGNLIGNYKTLEKAADAVRWDYENATITLLDDITLDSTWSVGGVVTIDLNGKTLNCTSGDTIFVQAFNGFAVTVEDSSENKTGVIRSETGSAIDVGVGSKFILNSGTITAENDYAIMAAYRESNHSLLEVNGGTVNGVVLCYADSVVSGGTFNDMFAISYYYKQNKFSGGIFNGGIKINSFDSLNDVLADGYHFRNAQGKVVDGSSEIIEEKVTIEKGADFSADAVVTAEDVVYNGAAQEPDVTVTIGGKILTEGKDYTIAFADNINAGTATVTVTSAGDYEGEIVKTFEIKKVDSSIVVYPEANKLTYNGEAQTLVVIGDTNDGMIVYSLDGEKYSLLAPTGTNAGEYTVYYKVIGDANHNDSEPETVIATIEKKAVSVSATVPDRIYGDDYQVDTSKVVVTFDGIVDGDDVGYVVIDAYYHAHTVTDNAPVQVVYNVNGADAGNYQFPEYGDWMAPNYGVQATGKVLPRDIADAEIILGDALIYNGTEQTQSIASVTVIGKDVTYDAINNTATNVGVYELTITGNGNFTGTKTVLFEVAPDTSAIDALTVDNVKSTDKETIEAVAKQIENAVTDLADDAKKAEYKAIADKCNELLAKIDATADEIARIDEAVNSYDIETVTSADIPALGKLIEDIKALTDGDNLTEDEKAALEANDEAIDELAEKLTEVAEEIKRVDEAVKSYDEDSVKSTDKADLDQLKADIQALIDSTNTAKNEKAAFEDMIKNIEGLEDKISETEEKLEEIKGFENDYNPETVTSDDKAAIEEKIAEIEAVNPDNLTDEQKAEYDEIKAGFEALLEEIEKAGSEVDSIGAELEAIDEKRVTVFWKDEIEALKAKIDELLTNDNMGEAEKARLNEYKAQCDNLIEIINTPVKYFSMRLFYLVWDALNWIINRIASVF